MFEIGFTDEPLIPAEPGEQGRVGLLVLGNHKERFVAHLYAWSEVQYVEHWKRALTRALNGKPSALITDMLTPAQSSHLVWWPMWKINSELIFHNQLLFFQLNQIKGPQVDLESVYGLIGEHSPHDKDGRPLSEWHVVVSDVEEFLDR